MNTAEFLRSTLDESGYQLAKALEGLSGEEWHAQLNALAMTPIATVIHVGEGAVALIASIEGRNHEWGTYKPTATEPEAIRDEVLALREQACSAAVASPDPAVARHAISYLALHEAYHVGQLCLLRLTLDPSWNPYSIYRF